ncbi:MULTISPECIES: hypothetical protein [unclassified Microcoleus]|uniref:hypothetical protein n=1 Tax=unclassified Microcoleus TaxID=2642155 RepID=UPI002FD48566
MTFFSPLIQVPGRAIGPKSPFLANRLFAGYCAAAGQRPAWGARRRRYFFDRPKQQPCAKIYLVPDRARRLRRVLGRSTAIPGTPNP